MIVILAGNYHEARTWASGQQLDDDEWVYPKDISDLLQYTNFHTVVIGTAGYNVPNSYFNRLFELAKSRGRMNRDR